MLSLDLHEATASYVRAAKGDESTRVLLSRLFTAAEQWD